jgi:SAM-dependent methyltransferase
MCHPTCIDFARSHLEAFRGKTVLEVGSRDVNGSVRPVLEPVAQNYVGVDIARGPSVDEICDVSEIVERFGEESFDAVVSTEMIEHIRAWRSAIDNLKAVLKPQGVLLVTTRSKGFRVHGWPWDYWRYEPEDFEVIFSDFDGRIIATDAKAPGVFIKATKSDRKQDLSGIALHSVVVNRRTLDITDRQERRFRIHHKAHMAYRRALPESVRARVRAVVR